MNYKYLLVYDLNNGTTEDYEELYNVIDTYKGTQISESSYAFTEISSLSLFRIDIRKALNKNDNAKLVYCLEDKLWVSDIF